MTYVNPKLNITGPQQLSGARRAATTSGEISTQSYDRYGRVEDKAAYSSFGNGWTRAAAAQERVAPPAMNNGAVIAPTLPFSNYDGPIEPRHFGAAEGIASGTIAGMQDLTDYLDDDDVAELEDSVASRDADANSVGQLASSLAGAEAKYKASAQAKDPMARANYENDYQKIVQEFKLIQQIKQDQKNEDRRLATVAVAEKKQAQKDSADLAKSVEILEKTESETQARKDAIANKGENKINTRFRVGMA